MNICHLLPKLDELEENINRSSKLIDIVGFTETFLNHNTADSETTMQNYSHVRRDRPTTPGGGEVLSIYMNDYNINEELNLKAMILNPYS